MNTRPDHRPSITRTFAAALGAAVAVGAVVSATAAPSDLISYEPFNYGGTPNIQFANGGTGWGGQWNKLSQIPTGAIPEGMTYPGLQVSAGSAITAGYPSADYTRYSRLIGAYQVSAEDLYISFLMRPNIGYGVGGGIAFGTWDNGMVVGIAPGTGFYGLAGFQGPSSITSVPVVQDQIVLVVARAHKDPGGTITWTLQVNPTLGQVEPASPQATLTIPGTALPAALNIFNDGGFSTDEIRVGLTWSSVLPAVPSPCAADVNQDGVVNGLDITMVLANWGTAEVADINGDGIVDGVDLTHVLAHWNEQCQ